MIQTHNHFVFQLPLLLGGLSILITSIILAWISKQLLTRLFTHIKITHNVTNFLAQCVCFLFIAIGLITALGTIGVDVSALITSLGLLGFAVGFATKDILSNALAGIMILIFKPFKIGDQLTIQQNSGIVSAIDLHYTTINHKTEHLTLIPNNAVLNSIIDVRAKAAQD